jgi:DNA-binding CsgD family transcriptional regulator
MTEPNARPEHVARHVGAAAEAVLDARGETRKLAIFEDSRVPMVIVDAGCRYVEVNRPARLWFRLSVQEMRTFAIGDLPLAPPRDVIERDWSRLLDVGCTDGRYPIYASDGSRLNVVYCAIANIALGLHLIAFAPADWPEHEFDAISDARPDASAPLTPREIEVLTLAADGLNVPDLADHLVLSAATLQTHFKNIYAKLEVRNRAAAVAKAMRLGLID